jgi:peptidyl-prolyl cis-trans isomerase C
MLIASAFYACAAFAQAPAPAVPSGSQGVRLPNEAEVKTVAGILAELDRDPDTVLADIGSRTVTRADVAAAIRAMPPFAATRPSMELYQEAVGMTIQQKALAARAAGAGLEQLPSVAYRLRAAAEDVLADAYLRGVLAANITDDVLKRAYDQLLAGKPGPDEVKARIIVTDSEKDAESAIERINAGASFEAVARTDSSDGTASNGGDLGYVRAEMLTPEVAAVLFSLDVGAMTAYPVQSGDHWFVLKVEGRRAGGALTFQEARQVLAHDLAVVEVARVKRQAVSEAKIVYQGVLVGASADALPSSQIGSPGALEDALALLAKSPGTVVAEVNGKPVTIADVSAEIRALPRVNSQATFPQIFREAARLVIERKALVAKADAAGLAANPIVRRRIETAQDRVLGDELLHRSLAPNLLEPAVKSTYETMPISKTDVQEVQLRVIAAATRADADDLLRKMREGAAFADLARASSLDSSAANGGLLDYLWQDRLAQELAAVGFSMAVGQMTAYPVRSGGLWYLVRCEGRRTRPPFTFAEARQAVEREIEKTGSVALARLALKQTNINYYGLMGKGAPAAAPK